MAGARAIGYLARTPIRIVARAEDRIVAIVTAPKSIPAADNTAGWTNII